MKVIAVIRIYVSVYTAILLSFDLYSYHGNWNRVGRCLVDSRQLWVMLPLCVSTTKCFSVPFKNIPPNRAYTLLKLEYFFSKHHRAGFDIYYRVH